MFAIEKLQMWIPIEILVVFVCISSIVTDVVLALLEERLWRIFVGTPLMLALLVIAFIIFCKDCKSLSRAKKADKDRSAILVFGTFICAIHSGFYQTLEVEVNGQKVIVAPKIPSWSYSEYYRINHDQVALLLSNGEYYLAVEKQ